MTETSVSITEGQRHELHEGLVGALGREQADTLMSMLPPVGWADVVTKDHLDLRLEVTESRIMAKLHEELRSVTWRTIGGTWISVVTAVLLNAFLA
jgi:hypothetical protein